MKLNRLTATLVAGPLLFLVGCSGNGDTGSEDAQASHSASPSDAFVPEDVAPVSGDNAVDPVEDPGLNVEWTMYGASSAPMTGDAVIHVKMENLNDVPVPPDVIEGPTLRIGGEEIPMVSDETSGMESGLDLPLGAGATTVIPYVFDTSNWNLSDAEFRIGNVTFEGNLNF